MQEIDEFATESEYCDFHVKRVLIGNGGDVEKDAVALDEEKGEIIIVELRSVHQFNDSIDNFVMRAIPSEKDSTSRALKWPDDDPTQSRPRRCSRDHVLQLSDKNHGYERGRRVFTTCTTGRLSSKAEVPTASFQERVDVQLRTLGDQITQMLMQFKQRVLEVADEVTMVASRADECCAVVSSLTDEVQQREESRQLFRMWS